MKSKRQTFYLPEDVVEWLQKRADEENRSLSNFLVYMLREIKIIEENIDEISEDLGIKLPALQ